MRVLPVSVIGYGYVENPYNPNPMKVQPYSTACLFDSDLSLQKFVNNLVISSLPAAKHFNTNLINEVKQNVAIGAMVCRAFPIISDLITTVVVNSRNGDIHISAARVKDVVILEIQERNNNNGYALAYSIGSLEPDAAMVGGHISINGPQKKVTTISFSFPDNPMAA